MIEAGDADISADFTLPCPNNSQELMIIEEKSSQEISTNTGVAVEVEEIDYPETDNPDNPADAIEMLDSSLSESPDSPLALPMTASDESDDDFRGNRKLSLQRSKKQSYIFGDSSDDEPEDQLLPSDIAMIDDEEIENTTEFSHSNLLRIKSDRDDLFFEEKILKKIPALSLTATKNRPLPLPAIPELTFASPIESGAMSDPEISQKAKRRAARKRIRTCKINKKLEIVRKKARILFL